MPDIRYTYNVEVTGDGEHWYPYLDTCTYREPQKPHVWSWCGEIFRLGSLHTIYDYTFTSERGYLYDSRWLDLDEPFPFLIREDLERAVTWLSDNGFTELSASVLRALHERFPETICFSFRL